VNEALKYNTRIGVHLNHTEFYPEAKYFSYDNVNDSKGWNSLDLSYLAKQYEDATDRSNVGLEARLQELAVNAPNLQWTYWDVYTGMGYNQYKLTKELEKHHWLVGSEFAGAMERQTIWNHVTKGSSKVMKMVKSSMADQYFYDPILLEERHAGSMGYGDDSNDDQGTPGQTINDQIKVFYENNLIYKYIQNHQILKWEDFSKKNDAEITFTDGLVGKIVGQGGVTAYSNGATGSSARTLWKYQPAVELKKDSKLVAKYQKYAEQEAYPDIYMGTAYPHKTIKPLLTQLFIPWDEIRYNNEMIGAEGQKLADNREKEIKIYHWNSVGGETAWYLPDSWSDQTKVQLFQLTDQGKVKIADLNVANGQVTINAKKDTPYVVYKADNSKLGWDANSINFGEGSFFNNPNFDNENLNGSWEVDSAAGNVKVARSNTGDSFLDVGPGAETISQTIQGLDANKHYQVSAWTEVKGGKTAWIIVQDENGTELARNEMTLSNVKNQYYNTMRFNAKGKNEYMQRFPVEFDAPASGVIKVILQTNEVSNPDAYAGFDDVRLIELERTGTGDNLNRIFFEDFESMDEGFGRFVPYLNDQRVHLSEAHTGYTSDTINGKYSLKIRELNGNSPAYGEALRTMPYLLKLKPNTEYTLGFKYWAKTAGHHTVAVSRGVGSAIEEVLKVDLPNDQFYFQKTFTTGDHDDYVIRFIKNGDGKDELIVDDMFVDVGKTALPEQKPVELTFDDNNTDGWVIADGSGAAWGTEGQLALMDTQNSAKPTMFLYNKQDDLKKGEFSFNLNPQVGTSFSLIYNYTGPNRSTMQLEHSSTF